MLLKNSIEKRGMLTSRVGCEHSFQSLAGTHVGGEIVVPAQPLFGILQAAMPDVIFECQTALIRELRMRKTPQEVESLRICHEIVGYAIEQAKAQMREGMKETELAATIESAITTYGVGYSGITRARGFAFVVSGHNTGGVYAWGPYNISTDRVLQRGDLVLIELDAYADGYWLDITRTFVVGTPDQKQQDIMTIILDTVEKVVEAIKPGIKSCEVDELARSIIKDAGYGDFFPHNIGHGVGFAFHEMPYLVPDSETTIEPGMVLAIEPGIYIPDWGGIRVEDNILIAEDGKAVYLSDFERGF
jgi:Xaa-Pro dipeptidase